MERRRFLGQCITAGGVLGLGGLSSCVPSTMSVSQADRDQMSGLVVADAHSHPHQLHLDRPSHDPFAPTVEIMRQVNVVVCAFAACGDRVRYPGGSGMPFSDTLKQLSKVRQLEEEKKVHVIGRAADVDLSMGGTISAVMAVEGGDALEGRMQNLSTLYQHGVRMITVLHDHDNEIGFNTRSRSDGPLTPLGVQVIEKMNELGIMVDVAHAKTKTLKNVAEVSQAPLVDSHTSIYPRSYTPSGPMRQRSWADAELIAKTGGLICTWPLAVTSPQQRTTLRHWAEEIVQMKTQLGIEHCGLGTDGSYVPYLVKGWESIVSLPHLVRAMRDVGLSQDDIAAYVGGNYLRLLKRTLG